MARTPSKQRSRGKLMIGLDFDRMDEDSGSDILLPPPSPSSRKSISRLSNESRMFFDSTFQANIPADCSGQQTPQRWTTTTASSPDEGFKPLDLSGSLEEESEQTKSLPTHQQVRRKRFHKRSESNPRKENLTPTTMNSDEEQMITVSSPYRVSPGSYLTMDGRFVTSNNPFSPMVMEETSVKSASTAVAPKFPVSFYPNRSYMDETDNKDSLFNIDSKGTPTFRHRLQKRDSNFHSPSKRAFMNIGFTLDGYPARHGQYSFTGSPIIETADVDMQTNSTTCKLRRLRLKDDVFAAAVYQKHGRKKVDLNVDTSGLGDPDTSTSFAQEISPTEVMAFPTPATPAKKKSPHSSMLSPNIHDSERSHSDAIQQKSRFAADFDIISELGKGSFGAVYKVLSRLDGCMYAVKTALRQAKGRADRDRMLKEVYALAALSDQADTATFHIVRYHQAWMEDDRLYIQTELCSSTLADEIRLFMPAPLPAKRRYKLLREMLLALEFIHRNGMVHLDIKPENVFLKNDQFKLGDFGLVTKISYHKDVEEGDSRYMSMELLSGDHKDLTKSDIFSLGTTLYEICLVRPLPVNGQEWQDIRAGKLQPVSDTPYDMEMITREMINPTYSLRPSAKELLKRPQLLSEDQKALIAEKSKVFQANLALALQSKTSTNPPLRPQPMSLVRRNTWSGGNPM